jgi:hypothetical protein
LPIPFGRTCSGAARIPGCILQLFSGNRALDRPTGALQTCVGSDQDNWNIQVINRLLAQSVFWRRVGTLSAFNTVTLNETLAPGVYDMLIAGTSILDAANLKIKFAASLL